MKSLVGIAALCLFVIAMGGRASAAAPGDGAKVYAAQKCGMCHSIAGKGNAKGPLDDVGRRLTADEIRQWLTSPKEMAAKHQSTRKPPMKSFASLPSADLDALVSYLQTLKASPTGK
jgi:mono/diheme cytochrome c family protein